VRGYKRKETKAVLVTGGAGYIGSHTCKALAQAGYLPVAYDNLIHGHPWAVQWGPFVEGDLADAALLKQTLQRHGINAVMHFAGYCYVGESMMAPEQYFRNNTFNTLTLLECMREADVSTIVFSSTCATYGTPRKVPMSEETPQEPINPYGESKLFVEKMLGWWGKAHGLRWMALRYFNAAGADPDGCIGEDHTPETHLIPLCIQAALGQREHVELYGVDYPTADGTAIRDYVHVTDLADAHVYALHRLADGAASAALNLGTGTGHSVREVIAAVRHVSRRAFAVRETARRPGDPTELVADARLAYDVLQWRPRHSDLTTVVETAWRWHSQYRGSVVAKTGCAPVSSGNCGKADR
jgi:UDP-arabinose 4-epimerase